MAALYLAAYLLTLTSYTNIPCYRKLKSPAITVLLSLAKNKIILYRKCLLLHINYYIRKYY